MLAHYGQGLPVDPKQLVKVAKVLDIGPDKLRGVMYELPNPQGVRRSVEPCPLSTREIEVLRRLRDGRVYKQIALELELSTSTVRTHLHNTYAKLGAVDRAQAVLIATQRGWI
jgi:DNA-binding NarL/FixJ family response regulator